MAVLTALPKKNPSLGTNFSSYNFNPLGKCSSKNALNSSAYREIKTHSIGCTAWVNWQAICDDKYFYHLNELIYLNMFFLLL